MRCLIRSLAVLACALPLASCDALFAKTKEIRFLCPEALLGLYVEKVGDEVKGELYLFDEAVAMTRDPIAACTGTSNCWRGIVLRSRSTRSLPAA